MIAIVDYGVGNLQSVSNAFKFLGLESVVTNDISIISKASHIVLPGVGAFKEGIDNLYNKELVDCVLDAVEDGRFVLGICLGMQLLMTKSYENGEHFGLNVIPGEVKKFTNTDKKVPCIGWNSISFNSNPLFNNVSNGEFFYFVHSYYVQCDNPENNLATTNYGNDYSSAVTNGQNVFGVQFHPEKSGDEGLKILKNFGEMR